MSRYIDADAIRYHDMSDGQEMWYVWRDEIHDMPTADVVEVVRCKDCINWQSDWDTSTDGYHYCAMVDIVIDGDFYCKDGERREDD